MDFSKEEIREQRDYLKREVFYYIDTETKLWRQRDGEILYIYHMDSDHLINCIKRIKKDIDDCGRYHTEVTSELFILANNKLNELKSVLQTRMDKL